MTWLKIDDGFPEHEKVLGLSDRAFRVHMTALCQCAKNLTDGMVDGRRLSIIKAIVDKPITGAVRELVTAGLWVECHGGHRMKDYLDYNPSAATVKAEREKARDRMRKSRSGERSQERSGEHDGNGSGERSGTPSRPVPSPSEGFSIGAVDGAEKPWDLIQLREIA